MQGALRTAAVALVLLAGGLPVSAFTLSSVRLEATAAARDGRDAFQLKAASPDLGSPDLAAAPVTIALGDFTATVPAGALRGKNGRFAWSGPAPGLTKLKLNLKKGRLVAIGRRVELGDLPAPTVVRVELGADRFCGRFGWTREKVQGQNDPAKRRTRKLARELPSDCETVAPLVQITTPTFADGIAVGDPRITLGGIASDDAGLATLAWSTDRGGGGALPVAASWALADLPLLPGDTRVVVTAVDTSGNAASDAIVVTYNPNGIVFDGEPLSVPDAVFVGEPETVTFRQAVAAGVDLDPDSVRLVEVDADGTPTEVVPLADTGDLTVGDEIQGDGIFTGRAEVGGGAPGVRHYRVAARTQGQPGLTAYSPVVSVYVITHLTASQLDDAVALATEAQALFDAAVAAGSTPAAAAAEVVAMLRAHGVTYAEVGPDGVGASWLDANEILGGLLGYDAETHRGGGAAAAPPRSRVGALANADEANNVGSRRALVLAPYFYADEPDDVEQLLENAECPSWEVESHAGAAATIELFKDLDRYGIVLIASHGNTWYQGILSAYREVWKWSFPGGQVAVLTGTKATAATRAEYERDLRRGRVAVTGGGTLAVLPSFIHFYNLGFPRSLVYVGSCRSTYNPSLASAFLGRGARTVFGYSEIVQTSFARDRGIALFDELITGDTTGEAFTPGLRDGSTPPAYFTMTGSSTLTIGEAGVLNAGFEDPSSPFDDVPGWTTAGDGRVVPTLGATQPRGGARMAVISTGLGFTTSSGTIAQPICLPPLTNGATEIRLSFDWNMLSEEFLEYCGSSFQDSFRVTFGGTQLYYTFIDALCGSVVPADVAFDRGDVHTTGWRNVTVDVTDHAGEDGLLSFAAEDVGDSIFDSAILIDNVTIDVQ